MKKYLVGFSLGAVVGVSVYATLYAIASSPALLSGTKEAVRYKVEKFLYPNTGYIRGNVNGIRHKYGQSGKYGNEAK